MTFELVWAIAYPSTVALTVLGLIIRDRREQVYGNRHSGL